MGEGLGDCEDQGPRLKSEGCKTHSDQESRAKDRIHLKPTHFAYAQHLEAVEARSRGAVRILVVSGSSDWQDVQGALTHYELSGTYRTESPRLSGASLGNASQAPSLVLATRTRAEVLRLCSMGMTEADKHSAARRPDQERGLAMPFEDLGSYVEQSDDSQLHRWCHFHGQLTGTPRHESSQYMEII